MPSDHNWRDKSEHTLDDGQRLIEASHRSLTEGSALLRQRRDISFSALNAQACWNVLRQRWRQSKSMHAQKIDEESPRRTW
jgi:hypothetical protein